MIFRFSRVAAVPMILLVAGMPAIASRAHKVSFAGVRHKFAAHGRHKAVSAPKWVPGQREIDPERTRAIQTALIGRNYLTGEPSGAWDGETEAAMQKFQADNGWQTKLMPDSRALLKLGLGPNGTAAVAQIPQPEKSIEQATGPDTLASSHSVLN